ncbi:thioredoxin, putative [Trypanosoma brucei gambiense DAL972]|uniref:Thioredoxin, putative n=1 Tax=Trypanosoma brucei gambiense (strain MHOM/CI/86/DAL972) TaxID=679716 RepID=C9ZMN6_TRYB9|nr:thioredoxin, putative [Trypanosoma brucei gambiense DAL972]CBH10539.1 thioredoxin, putative [Trypanosoma brucei gambiense DAL972]|eukprot:XP_011772828.1 thioredoxin, putative [Trypanosoma brucei gambiense DAL972]
MTMKRPSFLLASLLFLAIGSTVIEAFPFTASSGVVELTPATFNSFLGSHKPVFILFYAPWCGHCKRLHPEWEKFAKSVEGIVRVGAVNADEHQQLGQQFNLRGFPTVKFWGLGEKRANAAMDYAGERSAGAIQSQAISLINAPGIKTVKKAEELREAAQAAPEKKAVVLFSAKSRVPPIYAVLSLSPRLKSMPFYFAGEQEKSGFASEFGVSKLPAIVVLNTTAGEVKPVIYPGKKVAYEPIAKFLLACANDAYDEANFSLEGGESEQATKKGAAKLALPVRPLPASAHGLENFCSPDARKKTERTPLCVISLTSEFSLNDVHKTFSNEPLVFFEAGDARDILLGALRGKLGLEKIADKLKDDKEHSALLLRASKQGTVHYRLVGGVNTAETLSSVLQMVVSGEISLTKEQPK